MTEARRTAVVTGGGSGVGRSVAAALAGDGWNVVLAGRRPAPLEEAAAAIGVGAALAVPADVTDPAAVDALFDRAVERFGRVDLLFNNAGVFAPALPLDEVPVDVLRAALDTNILGCFLCARAAMRIMKRQEPRGGRIINNGSVSAYAPRLNAAAYTAGKHAVTGLTKALILEGRGHGIACGQIDIGNAVTDLSAFAATGTLQADGRMLVEPRIDLAHVAATVVQMATLPPEANIAFVTVMATEMPLYGRG